MCPKSITIHQGIHLVAIHFFSLLIGFSGDNKTGRLAKTDVAGNTTLTQPGLDEINSETAIHQDRLADMTTAE